MLISIQYTKIVLERIAAGNHDSRIASHLLLLGMNLPNEHGTSLEQGYVSKDNWILEARSPKTGTDYILEFSPEFTYITGLRTATGRPAFRVRSLAPDKSVIFETPVSSVKPLKKHRTKERLLEELCAFPLYPGIPQNLGEAANTSGGVGTLAGRYYLQPIEGYPMGVFTPSYWRTEYFQLWENLTPKERLSIRTWRTIDLRNPKNPRAETWWEHTSGLPDEPWIVVPPDRVRALLTFVAEFDDSIFDRGLLTKGTIQIENKARLIYLFPFLKKCDLQLDAANGTPFTRPLGPRHNLF